MMKFLKLLMIFVLSFSLVGCQPSDKKPGNNSSNSGASSNVSESSDPFTSDGNSSSNDKPSSNNTSNKDDVVNNGSSSGIKSLSDIPKYSGEPFVAINDNIPSFTSSDKTTKSFETYSDLDSLGRCGVAYANVGTDLMPTKKRGSISNVKPSGWKTAKYDIVSGKYLYNRCHLIGHQLTAEDDNWENLITGTRYFNVDGMLPFENMVTDYVKETNNHVLYRVTPIYEGNDLVARGVQMEGYSVEDDGEGICFNVFVYNVQPGITIDYATGDSCLSGEESSLSKNSTSSKQNSNTNKQSNNSSKQNSNSNNQNNNSSKKENTSSNTNSSNTYGEIRGNSKSKIYHCPGQASYDEMADSKYLVVFSSENDAQNAGYRRAKR